MSPKGHKAEPRLINPPSQGQAPPLHPLQQHYLISQRRVEMMLLQCRDERGEGSRERGEKGAHGRF